MSFGALLPEIPMGEIKVAKHKLRNPGEIEEVPVQKIYLAKLETRNAGHF